jgi:hypothetical protein
MKNEIFLSFIIGDFDDVGHDEITQKLGISPTKIYIKGQKSNPRLLMIAKRNRWILDSGLDRYASFEDHINAMLNIIEPKADLFRPFCEKYHCEFSCAIYLRYGSEDSAPSVHLNSRYNRLIRELNIEFDVDLYCLPDSKS